ncbi:precorrin-3B synthase [Friedmanniella luteola]|uniref:precorrin-3B synthase n=1 Tax=Friedmanniella luteola TaxID=546871 RepID=UPI0018D2E886|nr:precorrin-3B synthase [Friedmanniella luteola]
MNQDRCPGVLRPHQAADGAMVRVRVPGGQTSGTALAALGRAAERHGRGLLQLTSRAGLQVRGLPSDLPDAFEAAVAAAGFLPSASHERVRNVVASPLTGLHGGLADLRPLVRALDDALQADDALAGLSGRFLFGLDDGRGDVAALEPDLTYRALGPDHGLLVVGADRGRAVALEDAVPALLALARGFDAARAASGVWRVRELPGWVDGLVGFAPVPVPPAPEPPLGAVGAHAVVGVPLGFLSPVQLAAVTAVAGTGAVVVTPWRSLVVGHGADRLAELTAVGLVADPTSPWTAVSACVGAPWCASGRVDTQALVRSVAAEDRRWPRTHVSGCERRCGAPAGPHRDLVAPTRDELLAAAEPRLVVHV